MMDTMISVWTMVEQVRVASGAAELAIFTAILYWFFTSSRVADMLEVVGERVGSWCGRDTTGSLRQAMLARRRQYHNDMYSKLDTDIATRSSSLYRLKEGPIVPAPQPQSRPQTGLACARCAPLSRESWKDPKTEDTAAVINVLDIARLIYANSGVVSRWFCDIIQNFHLRKFDFKDVASSVAKDETFLKAIEDVTQEELRKARDNEDGSGEGKAVTEYETVRRRVEAKATKVLRDINSAMSTNVLRFVAWVIHKAVRRIADGGCGTRWSGLERLRRANAAGLPLVFVPLHRSHFDYILVTFALYLTGLRPPLVAAGDNMRIPFFGWFLRGCGAFYIRRRVDGSERNGDPIYKAALRAYILNSLSMNNNLEFFIEGGRTRTGKPQPPKAGILSVIMDAYLDGTIDDALLVPVTLNYDRLVDGNFVREQLGMPKQMETFWSALRGIWSTLNTNHGSIRVDYNQPISLKELVTSFRKYNHYKSPIEKPLSLPDNNNLAVNLDRQILYNHSHSSLYGDDVSAEHKIMVEAIGRHLVYDASHATALMCTNVVSYVLLAERRRGCTLQQLQRDVEARAEALHRAGRDLAHAPNAPALTRKALELLGRELVRREGSARQYVRAVPTIPAALELSYYANSLVVHYAAPAILVTALESLVVEEQMDVVRHSDLMQSALQLCEILSEEFILCPPCHRIEERMFEAIDELIASDIISNSQPRDGLEEENWSRRFAKRLEEQEDDEERPDPTILVKYKVSNTPEAVAERRRLISTIRPLLEAYAGTCRCLVTATTTPATAITTTTTTTSSATTTTTTTTTTITHSQRDFTKRTLDYLTEQFTTNNLICGEAVSTDAIRNCLRILRQWGVIELVTENKDRKIRVLPPYDQKENLDRVCANVYKFNMNTPLLAEDA